MAVGMNVGRISREVPGGPRPRRPVEDSADSESRAPGAELVRRGQDSPCEPTGFRLDAEVYEWQKLAVIGAVESDDIEVPFCRARGLSERFLTILCPG